MEPGTKFVPMAERTKKLMAGAKKFRRRDAAGKRKAASGVKEDPKAREARLEVIFQSLAKKTGLPAKEVNTKFRPRYDEFMRTCPTGLMSKAKFVELSRESVGEQADFLSDALFRVFDEDHSGSMDFEEYMLAVNATTLNSPEDKLKWVFNVFDKDGGGTIDAQEVKNMLEGLFGMSGAKISEEQLKASCDEVMAAVDADGDGEVTIEEFVQNAMESPFIASLLV